MAAFENGETAQSYIAAILERNGFVADARVFRQRLFMRPASAQSLSPDKPRSKDGDIVQIFAPDQAVMPVVMAVVLIGVPGGVGSARSYPPEPEEVGSAAMITAF